MNSSTSSSCLLLNDIGMLLVMYMRRTWVFIVLIFNPILLAMVLRYSSAGCLGVCWLRGQGHQNNPGPLRLSSVSPAIPVTNHVSSWPSRWRERITPGTEYNLVSHQCSLQRTIIMWVECYGSLGIRLSSHRVTGWCELISLECRISARFSRETHGVYYHKPSHSIEWAIPLMRLL